MDELLLGYLLGTLDEPQRGEVESRMAHEPQWQHQLDLLQERLGTLHCALPSADPPIGLADRTCRRVFAAAAGAVLLSPEAPGPVGRSRWRWFDAVTAACVAAALFLLVWPAVQAGRINAQINLCQNNLRDLGSSLVRYSELNNGYFPRVPTTGRLAFAGVYAPTLAQSGLLHETCKIICPAMPSGASGWPILAGAVPTLDQLQQMPDAELARWTPALGGSYGYTLGHYSRGRYFDVRNQSRSNFALMADAPASAVPGSRFDIHGGRGRNVLFEDGRVELVAEAHWCDDDIFSNDAGWVAAGLHGDDSVIVSGATPPVLLDWGR